MLDLLKTMTQLGFDDPGELVVPEQLILRVSERSSGQQSELLVPSRAGAAVPSGAGDSVERSITSERAVR